MNTENTFDWNSFLRQLSRDLLERLEDNDFNNLPSEVINERWFGYSGATDSIKMFLNFPNALMIFLKV